jgi:hypothetical protein
VAAVVEEGGYEVEPNPLGGNGAMLIRMLFYGDPKFGEQRLLDEM